MSNAAATPPKGRIAQIRENYRLTKSADPQIGLILLGVFVGVVLLFAIIGLLFSGLGIVRSANHTLNEVAGVPYRLRHSTSSSLLRTVLVLVLFMATALGLGWLSVLMGALLSLAGLAAGVAFVEFTSVVLKRSDWVGLVGWGLVGLSSIDGQDAAHNDTTSFHEFKRGAWYAIRVRVTPERISCFIDDKQVVGRQPALVHATGRRDQHTRRSSRARRSYRRDRSGTNRNHAGSGATDGHAGRAGEVAPRDGDRRTT